MTKLHNSQTATEEQMSRVTQTKKFVPKVFLNDRCTKRLIRHLRICVCTCVRARACVCVYMYVYVYILLTGKP